MHFIVIIFPDLCYIVAWLPQTSVYGHEGIKRALPLALFGGEPKNPGEIYCACFFEEVMKSFASDTFSYRVVLMHSSLA